ncbi:adhesin [Streptomyces sp. NPDC059176]|uniref:adhesin n=1 Tax=unclassified Streptomyces TaxID=2593676 RepID=UPI0036D1DBE3
MTCERCGGTHRGALPGMVADTCTGDAAASRGAAREPFFERGMLVGAGAVLSLCVLMLSATLLASSDRTTAPGADTRSVSDDIGPGVPGGIGGMPDRVGPTSVQQEPPSPSAPPVAGTPVAGPSQEPARTPSPTAKPSRARAPEPPPRLPAFSQWAGPGCANGVRTHGRFVDGRRGWYEVRSGGHRGDTCDGRFLAVPMSGAADRDRGGAVTWTWHPGTGYRTCSVAVSIPRSYREEDVAGHPTRYHVLAAPDDSTSVVAAFEIDQRAMRGGVAVVRQLSVMRGYLTIRLVDRGRGWGYRDRYAAHHAAAQIRADCTT